MRNQLCLLMRTEGEEPGSKLSGSESTLVKSEVTVLVLLVPLLLLVPVLAAVLIQTREHGSFYRCPEYFRLFSVYCPVIPE